MWLPTSEYMKSVIICFHLIEIQFLVESFLAMRFDKSGKENFVIDHRRECERWHFIENTFTRFNGAISQNICVLSTGSIRRKAQQQQQRCMHCLLNLGLSSKLCCDTQRDVLCHYVSLMCVVLLSFLPLSSSPMSSSPSLLSFSLCSFVLNQCGVKKRRVCVKGNGTLSSASRP